MGLRTSPLLPWWTDDLLFVNVHCRRTSTRVHTCTVSTLSMHCHAIAGSYDSVAVVTVSTNLCGWTASTVSIKAPSYYNRRTDQRMHHPQYQSQQQRYSIAFNKSWRLCHYITHWVCRVCIRCWFCGDRRTICKLALFSLHFYFLRLLKHRR